MLLCTAASVYALWSTVVVFAGGRLPLTGVHLTGNVALGIGWVFVADPLIVSLALAATYVLTVPIRFVCVVRYRRFLERAAAVVDLAHEDEAEHVDVDLVAMSEPAPAEATAPAAEHVALARHRADGARPRVEPARRAQPANRHRELVGPDTP